MEVQAEYVVRTVKRKAIMKNAWENLLSWTAESKYNIQCLDVSVGRMSARVPECQKINNGRLDQYGLERLEV